MNDIKYDMTLLTSNQLYGNEFERQLDLIQKYGEYSAMTDMALVTGGVSLDDFVIKDYMN